MRALGVVAGATGTILLPKCPMCVAGYLIAFGLGANIAWWTASVAAPAAHVLLAVGLLSFAVHFARRGVRVRRPPLQKSERCRLRDT